MMTLREKRKKFTNITDGSMMHKPLHRIREMGFNHKLFDLLDERALTKDELLSFFALIFVSSMAYSTRPADFHSTTNQA